ncbi:MAG: 4-(cytidine 5'-diphospho)-2-C-methyl-D-erythritol kinase [Candidatus Omnitrophica bacterium]|nr:4-(cytidine 5'-diphospho)-2-C-methyl-D-erythritol kinase [Candidatus Omnitrophota bacterium]
MRTLKLKAPAKVNLYLQVLKRRPDGFHDIETIFEKIDLCDTITLKKLNTPGIELFCSAGLAQDNRNLAYQAAQAIFQNTGCEQGVELRITKRIPVAAGLGGGSSDAASVLLGLNRLFSFGLSKKQLAKLAEQLGADVPFFIFPGARAIGRGKGEDLTTLRLNKKYWYILVIPRPIKVSTRKMYQSLRIALTKRASRAKIVLQALKKSDLTSLNKNSYNSFESVLVKKYRQILVIKKALQSSGCAATLVSGSGPCVFGVTQTRKEAAEISKSLRAKSKNWQVITCKTFSSVKNM